jgi:calcineurin-like phosphoesterase family protein
MKLTEEWREKLFFTSDTHFGHKNIIAYCDRPFDTVEEMDEVMINRWNDTVPEDGLVFHLGDVAMKQDLAMKALAKLNGTVVLIKGNHDRTRLVYDVNEHAFRLLNWKEGYRMLEIIDLKVEDPDIGDPGSRLALFHYPMGAWNYKFHGSVQLFGHVHSVPGRACYHIPTPKQYDIGVDNNDFYPVSYTDVMKIFTKKALDGN